MKITGSLTTVHTISYGHKLPILGGPYYGLYTLLIPRIPVSMHNVPPRKIFVLQPGTHLNGQEGQDFRACVQLMAFRQLYKTTYLKMPKNT